jgi:hypothetical protein
MSESNETIPLEQMTSTERDSWRMTGVEPVREPEPVKQVESKGKLESKPAPEEADVIAATEEEDGESGTPTKTEEQMVKAKKPNQMSYKDLRTRIVELEAKIAAGEKPVAADNTAKAKDDKKDANPRPKSSDTKADGSAKYQTWEEYEDDLLTWREEKLRATVKGESEKAQQEAKKQELEQQLQATVRTRADEARKKYPDFDAKVMDKDLPIGGKDSVLYTWIMDPENTHGMDIAYHYATHREDLDKFNKLSPFAQARELTRLEDKLSPTDTPAKSDVAVVTAPAKVTKAPPPAKEVGGRGASSGDEETALINGGEFRAYKRVVDKKEMTTRK